jgi:hypothetical protein
LTRPTRDQLAHAQGLLEELAVRYDDRNNPNGWPDTAKLLDFLVWLDLDLEHAKRGAVWTPGADTHTIGRHGLNRPVEGRFVYPDAMTRANRGIVLRDPLVKALLALRAEWKGQLGTLTRDWEFRARDVANWPERTAETG